MSSLPEVKLGDEPVDYQPVTPPKPDPTPSQAEEQAGPTGEVEKVTIQLPDAQLGGERMTGLERACVLAGHVIRLAADNTRRIFADLGGIGADPPESWVEYRAYVKSRAWVPEGCEGGWIVWVPVAYYNSLGCVGFAFDGVAWLFKRMLRFNITILLIVTATVLIWVL